MRFTRWLVPAAVLSLAACGAGDRAAGDVVVRDSSGVRIVESPAPTWGRALPWTVSAEPIVTIGTVEGDAAYQLHRVGAALRLSDGRIVVANNGSSDLRYYDSAGRHVRTVGRRGEGPGEFSMLSGMVRGSADTRCWCSTGGSCGSRSWRRTAPSRGSSPSRRRGTPRDSAARARSSGTRCPVA